MNVTIKGRRYNTEVSERLCPVPSITPNRQCYLYRKHNSNAFFLADSENVRPVAWNEAESLIKQYGTREQFLEYFVTESKPNARTSIDLTQEDYAILRNLAGSTGQSTRGYLHRMIHDRMKAKERRTRKAQNK